MAVRKRASKRLKVSTGDGDASKPGYVRKLAAQQANLANSIKSREEEELEESLFGGVAATTSTAAAAAAKNDGGASSNWLDTLRKGKLARGHGGRGGGGEASDEDDAGERREEEEADDDDAMAGVADDQLFAIDDDATPGGASTSRFTLEDSKRSSRVPVVDESDGEDGSDAGRGTSNTEEPKSRPAWTLRTPGSRQKNGKGKAPLWYDPADEDISVSLQDSSRLRKLRDTAAEDVVSGPEYEKKLRQQFRKIHPLPSWAVKARQKSKNLGREPNESEDDDDDSMQRILQDSSAGIRQRALDAKGPLASGTLQIRRLRDANQVDKDKSPITGVQFHPTTSASQVLFTTSQDRKLRLYQIDGTHNPLIQTVHTPELPITAAAFHPSGRSILLAGQRPFYYSYDLQAGQVIRSPRGLLSSGLGGNDGSKNDTHGGSLEMFKFSPDGRYVAFAGRRGYVHIMDWGTSIASGSGGFGAGNGGQVIGSVKITGGIAGLSWSKAGQELITVGSDADIYLWDVGTRRCIDRGRDDGGFGPTCVEMDKREQYFAVGSRTGIVNVYDPSRAFPETAASTSEAQRNQVRKPLRSIMNLTTSISTMTFNPTSSILALASREKRDSLKLVHLPSLSVFSNWPTAGTPLGHVSSASFSTGSEYLALGTHKGRVLLYSLDHYAHA